MTTSDPRWLALVREEAARTSIAAVAKRLEYSRTTISQVLSGTYPVDPARIAARAVAVLEPVVEVSCPHLGRVIEVAECQTFATRRAPTHNPMAMNHWRACRQCQSNCKGDTPCSKN